MMRRCFLSPTPDHETAAEMLSAAADALIADRLDVCEEFIIAADLRSLREFAYRICGPIDLEIHRQRGNPRREKLARTEGPRMPGVRVERFVFARDGYRCRYCSARVVVKEARRRLVAAVPSAARWGRSNEQKHFGLATLGASIDHVVPFGRGGDHSPTNLVTACLPCQFGRNQWTLEEVEIADPRQFDPIIDAWDGLTRLSGRDPKE